LAIVDWRIQGIDVSACVCDWGCPCQFMSLPTHGNCEATVGYLVERGHFGTIRLDGLCFGGVFRWPKAIHEGNGEAQPIVDVRASNEQREALLKIMSGQETEPGATIFNVFASVLSTVHPPLFKRFTVEADFNARTARVDVEGVFESRIEPIRNPITGAPSYAQISLPAGFEYEAAECASSTVRTHASPIALQWQGRHAHIARIDMTGAGLVRGRAA
jgi:hypothetical protein